MKAYGHTRRDKIECAYGCCTTKSGKAKNCRTVVDRSKRKKERQLAAKQSQIIDHPASDLDD